MTSSFRNDNTAYERWLRTQCSVVEDDLDYKHKRMKRSASCQFRSPDPFLAVKDGFVLRRVATDSHKVDLGENAGQKQDYVEWAARKRWLYSLSHPARNEFFNGGENKPSRSGS